MLNDFMVLGKKHAESLGKGAINQEVLNVLSNRLGTVKHIKVDYQA